MKRLSRRARAGALRALPPALVVAALVGTWELYADAAGGASVFLPAPHAVAAALWSGRGSIAASLAATSALIGIGLALAICVGLLAAVAIHLSPPLRRALYPLVVGSQAVPIFLLAPLLVFWLGFGMAPKLYVIVLVCFFPVAVSTVDGLRAVDPERLKLLRTLGASRLQAFRFAELPATLPAALSGARIAVGIAVITAVFAETSTAGTASGLGHQIQLALNTPTASQTARAWAASAVLLLLAIACVYAFGAAQRRLAPWTAPNGVPA